ANPSVPGSGTISLAGQADIVAPYAFSGQFNLQDVDITPLEQLLPRVKAPLTVKGIVRAAATLKGTMEPVHIQGDVNLRAPSLRIQNITTEELEGNVVLDKDAIHYRLKGRSFGGTFELEGDAPPTDKLPKNLLEHKEAKSRLKIRGVQLSRLV